MAYVSVLSERCPTFSDSSNRIHSCYDSKVFDRDRRGCVAIGMQKTGDPGFLHFQVPVSLGTAPETLAVDLNLPQQFQLQETLKEELVFKSSIGARGIRHVRRGFTCIP